MPQHLNTNVLVSMFIFLGIAFFRDLFGLIVGKDFREGIGILPVVLGANVLNGVWLNLSFWYKREERTSLAIVVTFVGLIFTIGCSLSFIPRWGYYGAAWARLVSEAAMVAVSFWLNRRFYPMPYQTGRILGYVALALVLYGVSVVVDDHVAPAVPRYAATRPCCCSTFTMPCGGRRSTFGHWSVPQCTGA